MPTYVIVTSNHCWAKAPTLPEAEKKLREVGGTGRSVKRVVMRFGDDTSDISVDPIYGGVSWYGEGPEILEDTRTKAMKDKV